MGATEYGPWQPLPLDRVVGLFAAAPLRWWVAGGLALELHLGRSWRDHDDTDIGIVRREAGELARVLTGWDIHLAVDGVLTPWDGAPLDPDRSQNNLWCRPTPDSPWRLDLTVGEGDDTDWIYRRDPTIRRRWSDAVLTSEDGTPYLAPEIQLLFKSTNVRPKDDIDASVAIPLLEPARRSWLASHLPATHRWQTTVRRAPR